MTRQKHGGHPEPFRQMVVNGGTFPERVVDILYELRERDGYDHGHALRDIVDAAELHHREGGGGR